MAKGGLRKAERHRWGEGQRQSTHELWPRLEREMGSGEEQKSFLTQTRGLGRVTPTPVPGHARRRNGDCGPSGPRKRCTDWWGVPWGPPPTPMSACRVWSPGGSVCESTGHGRLTDSTSWEAQGRRETEALRG